MTDGSTAPPPAVRRPERRPPRVAFWTGVACGVAYGVAFRLLFGNSRWDELFGIMSLAFLFAVPFGVGFLTVFVGDRDGAWSWPLRLFLPWVSASLALALALMLAWEGIICIFLWLPLFLVLSLAGGLVAVAMGAWARSRRARATIAGCLVALPLAISPLERAIDSPDELRVVENAIEISAPTATVWNEIARVRRFEPGEHSFAWTHALGFPRPVEATLSHEGVGGVRHASFEKGVVFVETITAWEPERRLAFEIAAAPDSIPARALDEHVTVGGPYFDVLHGEYRIEPLAGGRLRLRLASRHRLSTRFNFYSGLWTDFILADTQQYILEVIRRRCEGAPA
jgi:hypothetical protein